MEGWKDRFRRAEVGRDAAGVGAPLLVAVASGAVSWKVVAWVWVEVEVAEGGGEGMAWRFTQRSTIRRPSLDQIARNMMLRPQLGMINRCIMPLVGRKSAAKKVGKVAGGT